MNRTSKALRFARFSSPRIPFFPLIPIVPLALLFANVTAVMMLFRRVRRLETSAFAA